MRWCAWPSLSPCATRWWMGREISARWMAIRPPPMRYTEARLSRVATALLEDLDKETVDFKPNYDDSEQEPEVLPTRVPNLLVNGSQRHRRRHGDQHSAAQPDRDHQRHHPPDPAPQRAALAKIMEFVQGPDFPTGGFILGRQGILHAYTTGRGQLKLRAERRHREDGQGPRADHRHRDSLPGEQVAPDRGSIGAGQREEHRRHLRYARRERPRRHAHRVRAEARRAGRGGAQQPLQAHAAADRLRHHHALHRQRPAARAGPGRHDQVLHRPPHRSGPPAHGIRTAQGARARAHFARLPEGAGQSGRSDPPDPRRQSCRAKRASR